MKKKFTGLLAIIMVVSFIFSLAACGKDENENTTAAATTAAGNTTAPDSTTAVDETTVAQTTTLSGDTAATGESTTAGAAKAPVTVPEIVAYYNTAANKVKTDKPGYTRAVTNIKPKISNNAVIAGVAPLILAFFTFDKPETTTTPKGSANHISEFPLEGQNYGSKLQASSLKDAKCTDKGTYYEITMNFADEKLDTLPPDTTKTKHGQALNVLSKGEVDAETVKFENLAKVEKFAPTYTGCYITCKIDKAAGNLLSAVYMFNTIADITAKKGFTVNVTVQFGVKEEYTLKY